MSIPNNIKREHLLKAIERIDLEGIPAGGHSSTYDVLFNGKRYPPKLLISYANMEINGTELDRDSFLGGADTPAFRLIEQEGFEIVTKDKGGSLQFTKEEYLNAIVNGNVLRAQGRKLFQIWKSFPNEVVTATQLGTGLGYSSFAPANKLVGMIGNKISAFIKGEPETNEEMKGIYVLATLEKKEHWEWKLRPALSKAIDEYEISIKNKHNLWDDFLREWPKERLLEVVLKEYTGVGNEKTFTNWLEFRLNELGSIKGSSSFKFGVYKRKSKEEKKEQGQYSFTDDYAWLKKYGDNEEEAFEKVREHLFQIADAASNGEYEKIDAIDFPDMVKWKIAFLYQDKKKLGVINIFSKAHLLALCSGKKDRTFSSLYEQLVKEIKERDIFEYSQGLWAEANIKMQSYFYELEKFIEQAKTTELKTAEYQKLFMGLRAKVSFGQGVSSHVPWIGFFREGQTTMDGIYPVYLFYKSINCLILAKGRSETNPPKVDWPNNTHETITTYLESTYHHHAERYGDSYVYKAYDLNDSLDQTVVETDLKNLINEYKAVELDGAETNTNPNPPPRIDVMLSKPFILLAGISGTGKTRFVKQQAISSGDGERNFCLVPVRPDWHEPSDLLGYISRIGNHGPEYVITDVLKFMVKAWCAAYESADENSVTLKDISTIEPYWLCLDEMNLAPVEQYFADYLSVLETRKWNGIEYTCDALLKLNAMSNVLKAEGMNKLREHLALEAAQYDDLWFYFCKKGIPLPPNLIVAGTVNMDETTHGFSRKVLDRAFTIDFGAFFPNEFKYYLAPETAPQPITFGFPVLSEVGRNEVENVPADKDGAKSIAFLEAVNAVLKGSPFELAYRAVNELMLAVVCFAPEDDDELKAVWDDFLMTKVLPRIEGDADKLRGNADTDKSLLEELDEVLQKSLADKRPDLFRKQAGTEDKLQIETRSRKKLHWMQARLADGFTSFWP